MTNKNRQAAFKKPLKARKFSTDLNVKNELEGSSSKIHTPLSRQLLNELGSTARPEAERLILQAFGGYEQGNHPAFECVPEFQIMSTMAVDDLQLLQQATFRSDKESQKLLQDLRKLHASLFSVYRILGQEGIHKIIQSWNTEPVNDLVHAHQICTPIPAFHRNLGSYIRAASMKNGKGRIEHKHLKELALYSARLFESASRERFKILRHGSQNIKGKTTYDPVTMGHTFVAHIVESINEEARTLGLTRQYTSENIYNACEAARLKLNQSRKSTTKK